MPRVILEIPFPFPAVFVFGRHVGVVDDQVRTELERLVDDDLLATRAVTGARQVPYLRANAATRVELLAQRLADRAREARPTRGRVPDQHHALRVLRCDQRVALRPEPPRRS